MTIVSDATIGSITYNRNWRHLLRLELARIINYNCNCSFLVLATVITILNYDCKTFIVQATGIIISWHPGCGRLPTTYSLYNVYDIQSIWIWRLIFIFNCTTLIEQQWQCRSAAVLPFPPSKVYVDGGFRVISSPTSDGVRPRPILSKIYNL